ncbi:MAG: paraslipin, partial [Chloroflexi bacterium]|nr:paraslipin [Chloroflexota bacterium]
AAIVAIATATAEGIRQVAAAIQAQGGAEAVQLRVAEQYITEFGKLAQTGNTLIVPASISDVGGMIASAMSVIQKTSGGNGGTAARG